MGCCCGMTRTNDGQAPLRAGRHCAAVALGGLFLAITGLSCHIMNCIYAVCSFNLTGKQAHPQPLAGYSSFSIAPYPALASLQGVRRPAATLPANGSSSSSSSSGTVQTPEEGSVHQMPVLPPSAAPVLGRQDFVLAISTFKDRLLLAQAHRAYTQGKAHTVIVSSVKGEALKQLNQQGS
jgi:hypothetical protein